MQKTACSMRRLAVETSLQGDDTVADREPCVHAVEIASFKQCIGPHRRCLNRPVAVLADLLPGTSPELPIGKDCQSVTLKMLIGDFPTSLRLRKNRKKGAGHEILGMFIHV